MSRLVFGLMWLAHFLPDSLLARLGEAAGAVAFRLIPERRRVTRINLGKCFPDMPAAEREALARAHFRAFVRAFVDRGILWWGSRERVARTVRLEGLEHLEGHRRVILFAPHFVGLDMGLTRLALERDLAVMYSRQKDARFERMLNHGRTRFGRARLYARPGGLRPSLAALKAGALYYYLPDLDFGRHGAAFVPFFGVPAATTTGLSSIARVTGARVVPCVTRALDGGGYVTRLYPAWEAFPGPDPAADARRMNAFIEDRVAEMPAQYYWMHKRFKTRPEGEARFY